MCSYIVGLFLYCHYCFLVMLICSLNLLFVIVGMLDVCMLLSLCSSPSVQCSVPHSLSPSLVLGDCRIIFRIRQLHIIRWQMLVDFKKQIVKGMPAKSLGLQLPRPEENPPAPWWNTECDHSLMVGILKHGESTDSPTGPPVVPCCAFVIL